MHPKRNRRDRTKKKTRITSSEEGEEGEEGEGGEESGGDIAEMRWRMKGGRERERRGESVGERGQREGSEGTTATDRPTDRRTNGKMGNFQHTLCQNDIAAATARRPSRPPAHKSRRRLSRKWDGFYLSSIRRSITRSSLHFFFLCKLSRQICRFGGERAEGDERDGVKCKT